MNNISEIKILQNTNSMPFT